jgi:hypothetical protein
MMVSSASSIDEDVDVDGLVKAGIIRDCHQADEFVGTIIHQFFAPSVAGCHNPEIDHCRGGESGKPRAILRKGGDTISRAYAKFAATIR